MSIDVLVVLCGGAGERLWPASHASRPKPLIPFGGTTLLASTLQRFRSLASEVWLVCGPEHSAAMQAAAPHARLLVEPAPRGTGPAIALALDAIGASRAAQALVLVTPADHVVTDPDALERAIVRGVPFAHQGDLVTFGMMPTGPETGYGWIRRGETLGPDVFRIQRFVEKPDPDTAHRLLSEGCLWNGGLFLFTVGGLRAIAPDLGSATDGSFDVLVAERTTRGVVVPVDCGWSDVGTWPAVARAFPGEIPGTFVWSEDLDVRIDPVPGVGVAASPRGVRIFLIPLTSGESSGGVPRGSLTPSTQEE